LYLQRLQCIKYIILEFILYCCLSSPIPQFLDQCQHVSFLHLHTYVYIICTIFILPPLSPAPLTSHWGQTTLHPPNLFSPPVLQFYRRKNMKDKNKSMAFLLVGDKDSYTGRFLLFFSCEYILQPKLVDLYQSSSLLPSPLPLGLCQFKVTVFIPIE
jgi:hypothetical protein